MNIFSATLNRTGSCDRRRPGGAGTGTDARSEHGALRPARATGTTPSRGGLPTGRPPLRRARLRMDQKVGGAGVRRSRGKPVCSGDAGSVPGRWTLRSSCEVRPPPTCCRTGPRCGPSSTATGGRGTRRTPAAAEPARAVDEVIERFGAVITRTSTSSLVVQPTTRWHEGESRRTGWRASRTSSVEVEDLDQLGDLAAALTVAGAAIDGPLWQLDPTNPIHEQLRQAAAKDARGRGRLRVGVGPRSACRGLGRGARVALATGVGGDQALFRAQRHGRPWRR